jgi:hypothetical protein
MLMQAVARVICDGWLQPLLLICAVDRVDRSRVGLKVRSVRHRLVLLFYLWLGGLLGVGFGLRSFWASSSRALSDSSETGGSDMPSVMLGNSYDEDVSSIGDRLLYR